MMGAIAEIRVMTSESSRGFPTVSITAEIVLVKRGEIRCVDTGSLRDQILNAVVSTVAIAEKKGGAE